MPKLTVSDPPPGTNETEAIRSLLQPTVDRLNHLLQPHPRLDISDIPPLADMCGYDSQAEGSDWSGWSEWCTMFTVKEWDLIGYAREVARYYQVGQGSVSTVGRTSLITRETDVSAIWTGYGSE